MRQKIVFECFLLPQRITTLMISQKRLQIKISVSDRDTTVLNHFMRTWVLALPFERVRISTIRERILMPWWMHSRNSGRIYRISIKDFKRGNSLYGCLNFSDPICHSFRRMTSHQSFCCIFSHCFSLHPQGSSYELMKTKCSQECFIFSQSYVSWSIASGGFPSGSQKPETKIALLILIPSSDSSILKTRGQPAECATKTVFAS